MREGYYNSNYGGGEYYSNNYACEENSGRPVYFSSNGMYYWGPWREFSMGARNILEWFSEANGQETHSALRKEIVEGSTLGGYLGVGSEQRGTAKFYVILALIAAMSVFALLGGIGYRLFGKKTSKDAQKTSVRVRLIPLCLSQIGGFFVVCFLLILFSENLWFTLDARRSDQTSNGLEIVKEKYGQIVSRGNCEFESLISGPVNFMKRQVTGLTTNFTENFELKKIMDLQLDLIAKDQDTVLELETTASQLINQLNELKNLDVVKADSSKEMDDIANVVKMAEDELGKIYKNFDDISANANHLSENVAAQMKQLTKEITSASDPLLTELDDMKTRVKAVLDSIHAAYGKTADWINVVGIRNLRTITNIKKETGGLQFYLYAQLAVGIPSILAMTALAVGFLSLVVRVVYPKALIYCPNALTKTRKFVSISFYAQCVLVSAVVLTTGVSLYFAASLNGVCLPMYTYDYYPTHMDAFYKDVERYYKDIRVEFVDYDGKIHNQTISDVIKQSERYAFSHPDGETLIPSLPSIIDVDKWMNEVNAKIGENKIDEIKFDDQRKVTKKLKEISSELEDIRPLASFSAKSHLVSLVDKQIASFKRQLKSLSLSSLEPKTFPSFNADGIVPEKAQLLKNTMRLQFSNFNRKFENSIYKDQSLFDGYMITGRTMCVEWRTPAAGMWLSGTLLAIALLLSALVTFKTATSLNINFDEEGVPVSVSTIYAPLVDEGKNPTEREI